MKRLLKTSTQIKWGGGRPEYSEELVNLRVSVEDWLFQNHFCKDAGNAPDINGTGIASRAQQHLRGTVPQGHNLPGVKKGDAECGKTTHGSVDKER